MTTNTFLQFVVNENRSKLIQWLPILCGIFLLFGLSIPHIQSTTFLLNSVNDVRYFQLFLIIIAPILCLALWYVAKNSHQTNHSNLILILCIAVLVAGLHAVMLNQSHTFAPISIVLLSIIVKVMILKTAAICVIYSTSVLSGIAAIMIFEGNRVLNNHLLLSILLVFIWLIYLGNDHYMMRKKAFTHQQQQWRARQKITLQLLELKSQKQMLLSLATQDALTGTFNRGYFDNSLEQEYKRTLRNGATLGILIIDIDHFKQVNDTLGHQAGDAFLKQVAIQLKQTFLRATDIVCRYGGEEFAIIVPDTSAQELTIQAKRLTQSLIDINLPHPNGNPLTVSIGIALTNSPVRDTQHLIALADAALYQVKESGRNGFKISS
ncbi:GGDEF domain-containing protein [Vibrio gallicus]|uniref:GGDEF domain-containing protein n=1 Tax=Vibrio gallicus TaxID=190897 RepID=UPI0021C2E01B|nr:GGDEF domain-containing protein [Vibrio gallicus]